MEHRATVESICAAEHVPVQFAYKIMRKLAKAGYVSAARGVSGGFSLSADLASRDLRDLMASIGSLDMVNACMEPGFVCERRDEMGGACAIHESLCGVQDEINGVLASRSVASILGIERKTA